MNSRSVTLAILALCLGAVSDGSAQTNGHDHSSHHTAGAAHPKLNNGTKWATDAALRQGMVRIRDALSAETETIANGRMSAQQYQVLAQEVNDQVSFMVQNCKLDEEADAVLHLILIELGAAADAISTSGDVHSKHLGAERMSRALEDYATYFDHPGWHGAK